MSAHFSTIEQAIAALKIGKMIILMDDEERENEGDLVMAAEHVTPEAINFMATHGRGLICMPMAGSLIDKLRLPMMTTRNSSPFSTAFTVSIEAANGVTTGISAHDRARTILIACNPDSSGDDLVSPGHVFPLRACDKGVLERGGQTEGSIDLMKLAGLKPASVICEIMNDNGTMSRRDTLIKFARKHDMPIVTIKALLEYRIRNENLVVPHATTSLPMENYDNFVMTVFSNELDSAEHFALMKPWNDDGKSAPLVRIHSECITGDVFGSCKCDCGPQLKKSLKLISEEGGILIYLRQEGRGIGLLNKLKAYELQEKGVDTVEANLKLGLPVDKRDYAIAYQILKHYDVQTLRLLTNNPLKIDSLKQYGLTILERVPLETNPTKNNRFYLKTKKEKLGHYLGINEEDHNEQI